MNICRAPPPPIPYGIRGFAERPQVDPTKGLAGKMVTEKDLKSYRYLMETEGSRKANTEDYNLRATQNRKESEFGASAPFNGLTLDGVVDYTLSSFMPLYMNYGPVCFYVILALVTWMATWHIIEGMLTSCIAYRHYGCSPAVLVGFAGKLLYLPALPFVATFRHSHVRERAFELFNNGRPPPGYEAAEASAEVFSEPMNKTGRKVVEISEVPATPVGPSRVDIVPPLDSLEQVDLTYFDSTVIQAHWARMIEVCADMVKVQANVESMLRRIDEKSPKSETVTSE